MNLPWKGSRFGLVAVAAEERRFRFLLLAAATIGTVAFSFVSPQIIRWTIDSVVGTEPLKAPAFVPALVMMFSMDVFMSLTALALIPVIFLFSLLYFRRVSRQFAKAAAAEGAMRACAQENYTGVRVVRAFGREAWEMDRFAEKTKAYADTWINIGKMLGLFWGAGDFMSGSIWRSSWRRGSGAASWWSFPRGPSWPSTPTATG